MILIFLLILAFIVIAVVQEIERGRDSVDAPRGACPGCGNEAEADWLICPRCRELLRCTCVCGNHMPVFHQYCTTCGVQRSARVWR